MKHYYYPRSRAVMTDWLLAEMDIEHEQVLVDILKGEAAEPKFRAINPMGKIPTLVDDDIVVTEVAAICAYLADKFPEKGMAPSPVSPERGKYYRYLFVPGTTLEPMFTIAAANIEGYSPASAGFGDLERCLATIESMVPESDWVMGEKFSAADVVFGGLMDFAMRFGWLTSPSPELLAYVQRLRDRPAYQKSYEAMGPA